MEAAGSSGSARLISKDRNAAAGFIPAVFIWVPREAIDGDFAFPLLRAIGENGGLSISIRMSQYT
jgi:hypothetical protein